MLPQEVSQLDTVYGVFSVCTIWGFVEAFIPWTFITHMRCSQGYNSCWINEMWPLRLMVE